MTRNCEQCGKTFVPDRSNVARGGGRFCSKSCAMTARNLTNANPSHHRDISGANNPMFGVRRMGEANPMFGKRKEKCSQWKGGRKVRKDGYVLVVAPEGHPRPSDTYHANIAYILEHRLVMEGVLGRYLEPDEVVHHIDENPSNNAPENLRLFSTQAEHVREAHGKE